MPSCDTLIGLEVDWMRVLPYFLSGVCGVLVRDEDVVSGCGGVDRYGLCVLSGSLPPGRPRRTTHRPLRPVRPGQYQSSSTLDHCYFTELVQVQDFFD